jgi:hypothetical protein
MICLDFQNHSDNGFSAVIHLSFLTGGFKSEVQRLINGIVTGS